MKAALAISKIKNEDLKTRETLIEEMKTNLMDLKRQLLNEVRNFLEGKGVDSFGIEFFNLSMKLLKARNFDNPRDGNL